MPADDVTEPLRARDLLIGSAEGAAQAAGPLVRAVRDSGVTRSALTAVRRLSSAALGAVDSEVAAVVERLLDLDLGDLLVAGWRKYSTLTESARRTLAAPGSEEVLDLVSHRVKSTYEPQVDLLVDGVLVHSFAVSVVVVFDVTGVAAVVRGGELVRLEGGACEVSGTLTIDGTQVAQRTATLEPSAVVPLRRGIALTSREVPAQVVRLDDLEAREQIRE